jgi:hypothetical protein
MPVDCYYSDMCAFAATFYGRYWARTSDPQLVELGARFRSVHGGSHRFAAERGLSAPIERPPNLPSTRFSAVAVTPLLLPRVSA